MLFLLVFSLSIAVITITELPILIVFLRFLSLLFFLISKNRKIFLTIIGASFLALFSWQFYQRRQTAPIDQSRHLTTGTITDAISSGKYLYTYNQSDYLLYSTKYYSPGNQIRLVARNSVQPTLSPSISSFTRDSVFYSGFNVQKRSKMKGYQNILYETNSVLVETGAIKGFAKIRYSLRQRLEQAYQKNKTAGLVLGMLIGDKSKFTKTEYQLFIDSGLVHLVAVSGGNIVMLVTFLTAILFFVPFYVRITLILLAVISYGIICGMDSSVLRAVLMGSLSLVAILVGRGTSLWRLLGLVHLAMLIYNPYFLVYDVGYLLSFSAVLGIIFIDVFRQSSSKQKSVYIKPFLWIRNNYLKPSIGATLGIFPVIIFFMGQINIGGVIGNLFVLPIVPIIMIGGFIGGYLPSALQKYYIPIIDRLVDRTYLIANKIDQYGITIVADTVRIKFSLFTISLIMMILVIKTLTEHEVVMTSDDSSTKPMQPNQTHPYDDIIGHLSVEVSQK